MQMNACLFQRWMTGCAFAATLALVLVPTIGRLAGQASMPMHHAETSHASAGDHSDHGMPAADGHAMAVAGAHDSEATVRQAPAAATHHGDDEDCDYCALLLGTTALPVPRLQAAPPLRSAAVPVPEMRTFARDRHPTGLGSRGPPRAG